MIVVDASVAVRVLSREPKGDVALARLSSEPARSAPDWIRLEVANAMARKVREGAIGESDARAAAASVMTLVHEQVSSFELLNDAFGLSINLKHPMYDCLYLALARRAGCRVLTMDKKFKSSASVAGFGGDVELLA